MSEQMSHLTLILAFGALSTPLLSSLNSKRLDFNLFIATHSDRISIYFTNFPAIFVNKCENSSLRLEKFAHFTVQNLFVR